jgi:hypothetical protein
MDNFDLKKYLAEGRLLKEEKFNGAIIRKGSSDKSKEEYDMENEKDINDYFVDLDYGKYKSATQELYLP